ncbi:MAG: 30S ribosomal protein S6e [Sulfolobales archaeon]
MATFKVVVGDPEAKDPKEVYVRVVESSELKLTEAMKEGRELLRARANPKLIETLKTPYRIATIRVWKDKTKKEKLSLTVKLEPDSGVPEGVVYIPVGPLSEKLGSSEALAEIFRAKSFQIVVNGSKAAAFIGKKIGDTLDASIIGIPGKKLLITGGSDSSGFPMLQSVPGSAKRPLLLSSPPGYHPRNEGERRRKIVRGNTISEDIVQINTKLID